MELREEMIGAITVVEVQGRMDGTTARTLEDRLMGRLGSMETRIVLDLTRLDYIGSAGLRILLMAAKRAESSGSRLVMCGVSGRVRQLFDLGGFLDLFTIAGSREEGITAAG